MRTPKDPSAYEVSLHEVRVNPFHSRYMYRVTAILANSEYPDKVPH